MLTTTKGRKEEEKEKKKDHRNDDGDDDDDKQSWWMSQNCAAVFERLTMAERLIHSAFCDDILFFSSVIVGHSIRYSMYFS